MPTETLDSAPTLGALYGRALLTARSGGHTLPDRTLELVNVTIDPDAVADYAHVCGFRVGGELPITYPHMLAFPLQMRLMTDREFPLPAPGMVHLRNVITQQRPLAVGDPLVVRVHAERLVAHPKGAQVDLVSEVGLPDEEAVWHSRSTYFVRGAKAEEAAEAAPPEPDPHVGDRPHGVWTVPGDIGRRYAAVSGDVNPIHVNGLAAKAFGMPGMIAHGMWSKARVLAALAGRTDGAVTVDAVFRSPLRIPSKAFLYTAATKDGWDAALRSKKGKDHLLLTVRPA
ncbi:MaoC/PaaZ C-terminal domain-containing protein [Actinomycetospora sp. NBRC 106378]|uniref:MaoC family dehydratase n=1 Tax=Actinomycetospora sp. NBRC 106378 TaxID=3032208 RepID=UPI0024A01A92|nr:MaoC/PaaZ C-terminal domain-containing protein [Actinomycetospora sp. NBRC 106378]GLZ54112.1 hypothetical protein Acsp07_37290 [Actinomycetospora sp. NBRC 106378]